MEKSLYSFILNKEHHKYRHTVDWNLAEEYSAKVLYLPTVNGKK